MEVDPAPKKKPYKLLNILVMEVVVVAGLFYDSIVLFVYFLL